MGWFEDHLLRFLPAEFQGRDDLSEGDLRDFLEVVSVTLEELEELVSEFPTIFDVDQCDAKYLPLIAQTLNFPLDERDLEGDQRKQLRHAVDWYRRKGAHDSFRILFYSLGYLASLVELWTEDYETFHRYPGTWRPTTFQARVTGTSEATVDISFSTRNLLISIDGSTGKLVSLTVGEDQDLEDVASQIDAKISLVGGECFVEGGAITIQSKTAGYSSFVSVRETLDSGREVLGFPLGDSQGVDAAVPDDWPELLENGGVWYKSPHFGVEIYSIKDYVRDAAEITYLRDRMELVRPVHTVLDFLTYFKDLSDVYSVQEDELFGSVTAEIAEVWPFPICITRGGDVVYIRDGLVPDRSQEVMEQYRHNRLGIHTAKSRSDFEYEYSNLPRSFLVGPSQMPSRGDIHFFRGGYPEGLPDRRGCLEKTETLDTILGMEEQQGWCTLRYRDGGFVYRGEEDTYYRDGTFSKQYHRSYGYSRSEGPYTVPLGDLSVYAGEQGGLSDYSTDGEVVDLDGHVYVKIPILGGYYEIKPETLLEFTFIGLTEGDVHAVGFDLNDSVEAPIILFQVWGSDPGSVVGGAVNTEFDDYPGGGGEMSFSIPVGQYFPGEWVSHLVVLQDDEVSETASCRIKDVVLREQRDTEPDYIWGRSECNEITDPTHLVFERPDIPGVWFPSLEAMTNPAVLDLPDLPGPEQ